MKRNSKYSLSQHKWHSPRLHIAYWVVDALSLMVVALGIVIYVVMRQHLALIAVSGLSAIIMLLIVCSKIKTADKNRKG